ncbi:MAG TPA: DUF3795 domain-containing protein [Thermotogota bacterium]|nr:DUF3795 domain-containing protein [Thermotogota bacterium]HRW92729.1 DUF3795 domain-containing protein [Thermotogota bacterium]
MKGRSYCGLDCLSCAIFQATQNNDVEAKKHLAKEWSEKLGRSVGEGEIHCRGCQSDELFFACHECPIRECARYKSIESCAYCFEFPCDMGKEIWKTMPREFEALQKQNNEFFDEEEYGEEMYDGFDAPHGSVGKTPRHKEGAYHEPSGRRKPQLELEKHLKKLHSVNRKSTVKEENT